jgi:hypothetical protein
MVLAVSRPFVSFLTHNQALNTPNCDTARLASLASLGMLDRAEHPSSTPNDPVGWPIDRLSHALTGLVGETAGYLLLYSCVGGRDEKAFSHRC